MAKEWNQPEIVSLDLQETMSSITPHEAHDDIYGGVFYDEETNPGGQGYWGGDCGKS